MGFDQTQRMRGCDSLPSTLLALNLASGKHGQDKALSYLHGSTCRLVYQRTAVVTQNREEVSNTEEDSLKQV